MAISYTIRSVGDTMFVEASGSDRDLEDVENYGLAIIENAVRLNCRSILCDESRLEYRLGTFDTFESARFISERAPNVGMVAIVCDPRFTGDAKFWETVAVNRGLKARAFDDAQKALAWLTSHTEMGRAACIDENPPAAPGLQPPR